MKRLILLTVIVVVGCNQRTRKDTAVKMDSVKYPLLIDSGRKMVRELGRIEDGKWTMYLDTTTFTKGELYRQDSLRHPLLQFYLSYPEWKTISCIIAVDERDYGDKAMIGLIEKTGNLRISYRGQKLYLFPTKRNTIKEGEWKATFKCDSLEIQISGLLENKRILRSLTGFGELVLRTPSITINEKIFMVYEKE